MHTRIGRLQLTWQRGVIARNRSLTELYVYLRKSRHSHVYARSVERVVTDHSLGPQSEPLEVILGRTCNLQFMSVRLRNSLTLNFTVQEDLDHMVVRWIERLVHLCTPEGLAILLAGSAYQAAMEFRISFDQITKLFDDMRYTIEPLPIPNPDVEPVFWQTPPRRLEQIMPTDRRAANQAARITYVWQEHRAKTMAPIPDSAGAN